MEEFLLFNASLPDKSLKLQLKAGASPAEVAGFASTALLASRQVAFESAPIDRGKIAALAARLNCTSPTALAQALKTIKPAALEAELAGCVTVQAPAAGDVAGADDASSSLARKPKGSPVDFAFAYYLACAIDKALAAAPLRWPSPSGENEMRFAARWGAWQSVKKSASGVVKDRLAASAGIFDSLFRKYPEVCGASGFSGSINSLLAEFPERKSFSRLPDALAKAASSAVAEKLAAGAPRESQAVVRQAAYWAAMQRAGFPPFISGEAVGLAYPEYKIAKPRGNFKKKA